MLNKSVNLVPLMLYSWVANFFFFFLITQINADSKTHEYISIGMAINLVVLFLSLAAWIFLKLKKSREEKTPE